ncbi:MAG: hypothetical protein H6706_16240 [Myxococcales bacterium]|nr:hypothetical protein [Myxococcales bacterium]
MGLAGLGLAHELNSPLTATALALELLIERIGAEAVPPAELTAELGRILANVQRMTALVRHLRAFARGDRSAVGPVALDTVADAALRLARPAAEVLGEATLERGDADPAAIVQADPLLLEQALLCVLVNAVEAGASAVRVDVHAAGIEVLDDGPGFQGHTPAAGHSTKATGLGIGLSLVRAITEDAGGRLEVGDRPTGGGSTRLIFGA